MSWPKGIKKGKNGKPFVTPPTMTVGTIGGTVQLKSQASNQAMDLVLGVRHLKYGAFAGLWQLVRIENGVEFEVIDATSLVSMINKARMEIMRCIGA